MKKKSLIISLGSIFACTAIAVSCIALSKNMKINNTKGDYDYYTITLHPGDLTTFDADFDDNSTDVYTDQLHNSVNLSWKQMKYGVDGSTPTLYLFRNGYGKLFNPYEAGGENEIRGMRSIQLIGYGDAHVEWGWEKDGAIEYLSGGENLTIQYNDTCYFDNDYPNYFRVSSNSSSAELELTEIVIEYGKECQSTVNPYKYDTYYKYKLDEDHYQVTGFIDPESASNPTTLTFASDFGGIPVTTIAAGAFSSDFSVEAMDLTGSNIIELFTSSLTNCINLETITGFEQIRSFRNNCLSGTGLSGTLTFGPNLTRLEGSAFYGCSGITNVVFSDLCDPVSVDLGAFNACHNIVTCTLGKLMSEYPEFYNDEVFEEFIVPIDNTHLKSIDGILYQKHNVDKLILLQIPAHNPTVNYVMPDEVDQAYGEFAENCNVLQSFVYNNVVTSSGYEAFDGCTSLTSVTFGSGMNTLSSGCFYNCTGLTSINIPANINRIESVVFKGCTNIATFNYAGTTEQWAEIDIYSDDWHSGCAATKVDCTNGFVSL